MSIMVTGGTGFVGNHVLRELKMQYSSEKIIALSSTEIEGIQTVISRNYKFDERYLFDNGCSDIEVIIHIGAWTPKRAEDANDLLKAISNITNTKKLLVSYLPKLKRIIYCSTLDVYSNAEGAITEKTLVAPQSMYGWSKLYCEKMVESFAREKNLIFQILRLGHIYGEGEEKYRKVMPVMIKNAVHGKDIMIYGDGKAIRTFIYIEDVAKAIVNAIRLEISDLINVVGDEAVTINQLADMIAKYSSEPIKIQHIPTDAGNRNCLFDNQHLRERLLKELTPFEEGLKKEIDYAKRQARYECNI